MRRHGTIDTDNSNHHDHRPDGDAIEVSCSSPSVSTRNQLLQQSQQQRQQRQQQFSSTRALPPPSPPPYTVSSSAVSTVPTTAVMTGSSLSTTSAGAPITAAGAPVAGAKATGAAAGAGAVAIPQPPITHDPHRATHTVRLSALRHNYAIVEDAASRQRCSVIVVVKADGYGHGSIVTAVHLADYCGADAFAVATLEEGIALRRALSVPVVGSSGAATCSNGAGIVGGTCTSGAGAAASASGAGGAAAAAHHAGLVGPVGGGVEFGMMPNNTPSAAAAAAAGGSNPPSRRASDLVVQQVAAAPPSGVGPNHLYRPTSPSTAGTVSTQQCPSQFIASASSSAESLSSIAASALHAHHVGPPPPSSALPPRNRSPRIRILVLGPPVGYPRSFDLYHHHGIELMVSGPEVARALMDWVTDAEERKRTEVERAAAEFMGEALTRHVGMVRVGLKGVGKGALEEDDDDEDDDKDLDAGECAKELEEKDETTVTNTAIGDKDDENDLVGPSHDDKATKKERPERVADDEKKDDTVPIPVPPAGKVDRSRPPRPRPVPNPNAGANANSPEAGGAAGGGVAGGEKKLPMRTSSQLSETVGASATLSAVTGDDLAREVRAILLNNQAVAAHVQKQKEQEPPLKKNHHHKQQQQQSEQATSPVVSREGLAVSETGPDGGTNTGSSAESCAASPPSGLQQQQKTEVSAAAHPVATIDAVQVTETGGAPSANAGGSKGAAANTPRPAGVVPFRGIEDAAKLSRDRQLAAQARLEAEREARAAEKVAEDDGGDDVIVQPNALGIRQVAGGNPSRPGPLAAQGSKQPITQQRKKLRWHALVDSGMGRLGFKPDPPGKGDNLADSSVIKPRKPRYSETIALIKELHDLEVRDNGPIEFYGMCTHMADATSTSTYTHSQMERFLTLLNSVRAAGIPVPTVSTDNSAALLTTTLNHFDPAQILSQPGADTRGFVRTGGAIFGQRPSFPQLRAISTLTASVRHVSVIKEGDSVGYDRAYTATMDVRIATLTIGFADGYPRDLGNGVGRVSIRGSTFPVAGNVCMDMMMVELGPAGDTTGAGASVAVGDVATLWGPEGPEDGSDGLVRLQDIAASLKTTQSALTCGLDKVRVERKYVV